MTLSKPISLALAAALAVTAAAPMAHAQTRKAAATPVLSTADLALAAKARSYLQNLGTIRGRFTQVDPGGGSSSGEIYIQRPGKARFAYDEPKSVLIVSDGRQVSVYDRRLKSYNAYPLASTPLSLFLAREIRLDRGVEVTKVTRFANGFALTARDKGPQTRGWINLTIADDPMRLTEWTVTDAQGRRTRVTLSGLRPASGLDASLFVVRNPVRAAAR
ncbi:MAG: LolA family protein [Caulobacteraceae bacterium]